MRHIILVLHTDDWRDPARFLDLRSGYIAQSNMPHQALALELGKNREGCLDRAFGGFAASEQAAQVDNIEHIETEIVEVVMDRLAQFCW